MSSSGKPPKPVDPNAAAQAQATWNRFGQQTPFGSVRWEGEGPNQTQVTQISPELMAMFSGAADIANRPREQYAAPEGFSDYRQGVISRMNDRNAQGRPVYQPTQTFGGTLGIPQTSARYVGPNGEMPDQPGAAGGGMGGGGGGGMMVGQPVPEGGPTIGLDYQKPDPFSMDPGKLGPIKPAAGPGEGGLFKPAVAGGGGGGGPGQKNLLGDLARNLNPAGTVGSDTPWRDAFLGPVGEGGERNTLRHMMTGGLQGSLGRGLVGQVGNWFGADDRRRAREFTQNQGQPQVDRVLGQIGERFAQQQPGGGSAGGGLRKPGPSPKPPGRGTGTGSGGGGGVGGGSGTPGHSGGLTGSNRGRMMSGIAAMRALGGTDAAWARARAAMGIGDWSDQER